MSVSYNIFPINELQTNAELNKHIRTLTIYGNFNPDLIERESRFPTVVEVFKSIDEAELKIIKENKRIDEFELKNGKEIIIHSLEVNDKGQHLGSDLTMRYLNDQDNSIKLNSLFGINSDLRILVKILASVTKKCGSFLILNPYEGYFVDKKRSFSEIWNQILNETNYISEE